MPTNQAELAIRGMSCASCVGHVTQALEGVTGVTSARVNLATERARVEYAGAATVAACIAAVEAAGYDASIAPANLAPDDAERARDLARKRNLLVLAVALFVPSMVLSMAVPDFNGKEWAMLALALPIWAVVGWEFHRSAFAALRHGTSNMDTLVSLGSTAAMAYSLYATVTHRPSFYETAGGIVTLIFVGKYLEAVARGKTGNALRLLLSLRPDVVRVRRADGAIDELPIDDVRVGDLVVVPAGERIAVDGIVVEGRSAVDVSMLTGESLPTEVLPDVPVKAGTLNGNGSLVVRTTAVGSATTLAKIVAIVSEAQGSTPPVQRLADRVASIFVPVILTIAALTFSGWIALHHPWPLALSNAVAVLVVACPCALGLATPTAIVVAVGIGASQGVLFKDALALERVGHVGAVVFDKTGTLTVGQPQVAAVSATQGSVERVLATAASLERASSHPLAGAIVAAAQLRGVTVHDARDVLSEPGRGVRGTLDGRTALVGNRAWIEANGVDGRAVAQARGDGTARVFVAYDGLAIGSIDVRDVARNESADAVAQLHELGIDSYLVSGDETAAVERVAHEVGIREWQALALPQDKAAFVRALQSRGARVAFVGDGINDAPALAVADVGLAMGGSTEIAMEAAQAAIVSNDPRAVPAAVRLSRASMRTIHQNLFWAVAYNAVLVPLAVAGVVHPLLAAGAMGVSSLFVVGNSLLLRARYKPGLASVIPPSTVSVQAVT